MSDNLDQHIFTSVGAFKTVARSAGITRDIQAELEARVCSYSRDAPGKPPPLVYRAFRVKSAGTYAVSLLIDTGAEFSKASGNYLAHSYVIPDQLLQEVGFNLAWIAAHLPIQADYRPRSGAGIDDLAPLPNPVDTEGQFRLVSLLWQDLKPDGVRKLLEHLLLRLAEPKKQDLPALRLPPPPPNLDTIIADTLCGTDGFVPPTPSADELCLWRLAAALAFFPTVFRQAASFTLNEPRVRQGSWSGSSWAITVLRTPIESIEELPEADLPQGIRQWIEYCVDPKKTPKELQDLQAWLSKLLCAPSQDALHRGFTFYNNLVNLQDKMTFLSPRNVLEYCKTFIDVRSVVNVQPLYEGVQDYVARKSPTPGEKLKIYVALCKVDEEGRVVRDNHPLLESILTCLADSTRLGADESSCYLELPMTIQQQIWELAEKKEMFPAYVQDQARPSPQTGMAFALCIINPLQWSWSPGDRERTADRFVKFLKSAACNRPPSPDGLTCLRKGMEILLSIFSSTKINGVFLADLMKAFAREFVSVLQQRGDKTQSIIEFGCSLVKEFFFDELQRRWELDDLRQRDLSQKPGKSLGSVHIGNNSASLQDFAIPWLRGVTELLTDVLSPQGRNVYEATVPAILHSLVLVFLQRRLTSPRDADVLAASGHMQLFLQMMFNICKSRDVREQLAVQMEFVTFLTSRDPVSRTSAGRETVLPQYTGWINRVTGGLQQRLPQENQQDPQLSYYQSFHRQLQNTIQHGSIEDLLLVADAYLSCNRLVPPRKEVTDLLLVVIKKLQSDAPTVQRLLYNEACAGRDYQAPRRLSWCLTEIVKYAYERASDLNNRKVIEECLWSIIYYRDPAITRTLLKQLDQHMSRASLNSWRTSRWWGSFVKQVINQMKRSW